MEGTRAQNASLEGFIDINGFKIRYQIEGYGCKTAVIIGSALYYKKSFPKALQDIFRMVFIDWRGFSKAPQSFDMSQIDFDTLLDDIEVVRSSLKIEDFVIIGHSAHAILALEYAKKYSQHVSHVIMIGMSPNLSIKYSEEALKHWNESASIERKQALEQRLQDFPDVELAKLPPSERFVKWYIRRDPQGWYDYTFDSTSLWDGVTPNMPLFDFFYGDVLQTLDITKGLENFHIPVLLCLGQYDYIVAPPSAWEEVKNKYQNFTLHLFEKSGHSPQYEEPFAFVRTLEDWIKGLEDQPKT